MEKAAYSYGFSTQENEISADELSVQGHMPEWLSGSLIRTAPSKFEVGKSKYRHWFDGLAMLHKFTIHEGKVDYSCKLLESESYLQAKKKNKIVYGEFGTDPCSDLFQKMVSVFQGPKGTDNGCVNVLSYGNKFTANTETTKPVSFNSNTLETEGGFNFEDELFGQITTVHPHYDKQKTIFSYFTEFGYKGYYHVYAMAENSHTRKLIASLPVDEPAYMHSIGMTDKFIILTEVPLLVNQLKFRFANKPFIENYQWKPDKGTKIHLIEKRTGNIKSFEIEPFFAFHHVNGFEQDEEVVFDIVGYENAEIIDNLYLDHLRSSQAVEWTGQLWRFRIKPTENSVSKEIISTVPFELPRINYDKVNGQPYKYAYGTGTSIPGNFFDNITKVDVSNGEVKKWHADHCYHGEAVFVEKPSAKFEDEGVLLSVVLDVQKKNSFLLVLDAKDLKEIARAQVPQHITFALHGQFVPD